MHRAKALGQAYIVGMYSLLGFLTLTIFGTLHIVANTNSALGYLEIATGLAMALNVLGLRVTRNVGLARVLFLCAFLAGLVVMLASGGTGGTGIFWFFLFPVAAFFLTDTRRGAFWVAGLLGLIVLLWMLDNLQVVTIWYGDVAIRQLLVSLVVVSVAIYIYQEAREIANQRGDDSQHDLQEYLDHMTTYSAKIAVDGTILFANKALKDAYGPSVPAIGSNFLSGPWWSDPDARSRVKAEFEKALSGTAANYDERFEVATSDGRKELTINFSMIPIMEGDEVRYVLAEARDITAEKAVDQAKSEFVTLASHQLRTPIAAIRWFSEMLLNGDAGDLDEEQQDHVEQIYHSNQRMANLVDEMLIVSSLELGNLPVTPEPLDVASFCSKVVHAQDAAANDKKIVIRDHYDKNLAKIQVDPHILRIILRNLVTNAIKYTPSGGSVSLEVTKTTKKLTPDSQGSVAIMLNDSGYGIPRAAQDEIFTKFFRAKNIRDKDTDGTGLGLYMVKMLLGYVGGAISFTSTENVGSTFVVELPLEGMKTYQPKNSVYPPRPVKKRTDVSFAKQ